MCIALLLGRRHDLPLDRARRGQPIGRGELLTRVRLLAVLGLERVHERLRLARPGRHLVRGRGRHRGRGRGRGRRRGRRRVRVDVTGVPWLEGCNQAATRL